MNQFNANAVIENQGSEIPGIRCKKYDDGDTMIKFVEYEKKLASPECYIQGDKGFVISGEFEIDFNGTIKRYREGDVIDFSNEETPIHKGKIISDKVNVFLVEKV